MQEKNTYSHILKYTGIFGGVQGLNILVGIVRNKLVALLLGPTGMGMASLLNSIANFAYQATSLGISFSAVKHLSEIIDSGDDSRISSFVATVRAWSMVTALLGAAVCMAAAPALDRWVFDGGGHTAEIMALAPVVAMMAVTGGETAILKGARRLRHLAEIQMLTVFASLVISVPVYAAAGIRGIIYVILLMALANMGLTARRSLKAFPLKRLTGGGGPAAALSHGGDMVRLGLAFIVTGVMGSGVEMAVRSLLNNYADLGTVGLYNAGYMLTVTYAGMVFSAMETDYFPRLSAINHDTAAVNLTANRQIEVSLLIISPLLTLVITALPLLVPLLYSGKFAPVVPMAQVAALSMYARAMMLPVAYITLAKSHSKAYIVLETLSALILVALIPPCFGRWGLIGAGAAILLSNAADLAVIILYARLRYRFRLSRQVIACAASQIPLGVAAYAATLARHTWVTVTVGVAATAAGTAVSVYVLSKKTDIAEKIRKTIRRHRER